MAWTNAQQHRDYRARHKAAGLCGECSQPVVQGKSLCEYHVEKWRQWHEAHRPATKPRILKPRAPREPRIKRIKPDEECAFVSCTNTAEPDRKKCAVHLAADAARQLRISRKYRTEGRCFCGLIARPSHTTCERCAAHMRQYMKQRRIARQAAGLCVECGQPSEFKQARCLTCSSEHRRGLPQPIRAALLTYRKQQEQEARDAQCRTVREFIERHSGLIKDDRRLEILRRRHGYTTNESETLEQIGELLGVTRQRIQQLQDEAEEMIYMFTIEKDIPLPPSDSPLRNDAGNKTDT